MKKILIATTKPFAKEAVNKMTDIFTGAGYTTQLLEKYNDENELHEAVKDVDGLIVRSDIIDPAVIENASNLKIVIRAGAGYDNIDLDACSSKNITVMNTPGQNANAVAELVFGMMIHLIRNGFNGTAGTELRNKKLGIHAYGHVGRIVGMIGKGFGMKVYAYDPFIDKIIIENDGVKYESDVAEMYRKCQYISLHLPLAKETRESINSKLLLSMPEKAMLVNTARKELIHEEDLLKTFRERSGFMYASDIAPDCK
ncbi:MAG: NAD(P)-dependent oxidoreductase, partial [Bacteroidota bacterium]